MMAAVVVEMKIFFYGYLKTSFEEDDSDIVFLSVIFFLREHVSKVNLLCCELHLSQWFSAGFPNDCWRCCY